MEEVVAGVEKKERHRSPNYPAVGLREAVERVTQFYLRDGKAGAQPDIAALHIGFGSPHGGAMSVLAALKRFGLVNDVSGRLVPSQAAIEIINLPINDQRRKNALKEAALKPSIYQELVDEYRTSGLPSAEALEAELKTYRKFNPKAVGGFVRDFLDTLEYAGINPGDDVTEAELSEIAAPVPAISQKATNSVSGASEKNTLAPPSALASAANGQPVKRTYPLDISIPRGLKAELSISGEFRQEDLVRLKTQIGRLIENLQDAFED